MRVRRVSKVTKARMVPPSEFRPQGAPNERPDDGLVAVQAGNAPGPCEVVMRGLGAARAAEGTVKRREARRL